jgi:hypothetical protein
MPVLHFACLSVLLYAIYERPSNGDIHELKIEAKKVKAAELLRRAYIC